MGDIIGSLVRSIAYVGSAFWDPIKRAYVSHRDKRIEKFKAKFRRDTQKLDPFSAIAQNGLQTSLFVHGGYNGVDRCCVAAMARIRETFILHNRIPIFLQISQGNQHDNGSLEQLGFNKIRIDLDGVHDVLPVLLKVQESIRDLGKRGYIDLNVASSQYINPKRGAEKHEFFQDILSYILTPWSKKPSSVIVVVIRHESLYPAIKAAIEQFRSTTEWNFMLQYIHIDNYAALPEGNGVAKNTILFPMYGFEEKGRRMKQAQSAFPKVNTRYMGLEFWHYHQVIYNIDGKQGVYFMERKEVRDD